MAFILKLDALKKTELKTTSIIIIEFVGFSVTQTPLAATAGWIISCVRPLSLHYLYGLKSWIPDMCKRRRNQVKYFLKCYLMFYSIPDAVNSATL